MTLRLNNPARNAVVDALGSEFDDGVLEIRSGSQPTSANDAATGDLLASFSLPASAFTAAVEGSIDKDGTWSTTVATSGTAGWFRFRDSGDTVRMDGSITLIDGGGDIEVDNADVIQDGTLNITQFVITQPPEQQLIINYSCTEIAGEPSDTWYEDNEPVTADTVIDWPTDTPESQGMDSTTLTNGGDSIQNENYMQSMLVARNGVLVFERYYNSAPDDRANNIHSGHKTMLAAYTGIAVDKNIVSTTDTLNDILAANYTVPSAKQPIQIQHLLELTSGIAWTDDFTEGFTEGPNRVQEILDLGQDNTPGTTFNYSTADTHLLGACLTLESGDTLCDIMHSDLFAPIGIKASRWTRDGQSIYTGGYGIYMTPRDYLRFGQLLLNGGMWGGNQIIPSQWVTDLMTAQNDTGGGWWYGYGNWITDINTHTANVAWGFGGQMLYMIPSLNLLTVFTTDTFNFSPNFDGMSVMENYVIPAVN